MREGLLIAGKYTLLRPIGAGGMGTVWRARNELTEREFAIKLLHPAAANNPRLLMRFFQEAKVSGRLRHPSILEIFDVGTAPELGGAPFLVMELLDGASIDILLAQRGPLPLRLTLQILIAIASALALAHARGIIHRDLKPANIFLHRMHGGGVVPKLLDFGISKIIGAGTPESTIGLTQTGAVLGSPLYMSPEQAAGDRELDARSDIHALGVVLWECLTGKAPFKGETYNKLVVEIMTGDRPRLMDTLPTVSPMVSEIAARAYARRAEDRFTSALELAAALKAELTKLGPGQPLDSPSLADELFANMHEVETHTAAQTEPRASTTGAVSLGTANAAQAHHAPHPPNAGAQSPAAYTLPMPGPNFGTAPLAYAQTEAANAPYGRTTGDAPGKPTTALGTSEAANAGRAPGTQATTDERALAAAATTGASAAKTVGPAAFAAPRSGSSARKAAIGVVAVSALALAATAGGVMLRRAAAPVASATADRTETPAAALPATVTATASAAASPSAPVADAGASTAATAAAPAPAPHVAPKMNGGGRPATRPTPATNTPSPTTAAPDPHHGITNSGL